ncbi:MAG: hypothetical protein V4671_09160 [Armatimonadota bacterium]
MNRQSRPIKTRQYLAVAIATLGLATLIIAVVYILIKERPNWLTALFVSCVAPLPALLWIDALLAAYEAGRWEQTKKDKNILDKDSAQEGVCAWSLITLFSALIISGKSHLSFPIALLYGAGIGLILCLCFALVIHFFHRIFVFIVDRFIIDQK